MGMENQNPFEKSKAEHEDSAMSASQMHGEADSRGNVHFGATKAEAMKKAEEANQGYQ